MLSRSLSARSQYAFGVLLILALVAFMAVPASAKKKSSKSKSKSHATKLEKYDKRKAKQEIQLMKKMIDQRQAAINLALIGDLGIPAAPPVDPTVPPVPDTTVTSATIKAYCQAYALRMQTEQALLLTWLKDWHKVSYKPKHQAPAAGDDEDEDTLLDLTGNEFVAGLLDEMIGVHMRGVAFQKQADKKGLHPELREFAKGATKLDLAEVAQIKAWIKLFEPVDDDDEEDEG